MAEEHTHQDLRENKLKDKLHEIRKACNKQLAAVGGRHLMEGDHLAERIIEILDELT